LVHLRLDGRERLLGSLRGFRWRMGRRNCLGHLAGLERWFGGGRRWVHLRLDGRESLLRWLREFR
jgi:hypothetical protein